MSHYAKIITLVFLLGYCPDYVAAHPVDDLCVNGIHDDKCQVPVRALGFDNPEFVVAHKAYWHCRRALVVEDIVPYGACTGAVAEFETLLNVQPQYRYFAEPGLLEYWNVIPAHPELDFPGEAWRPRQQLGSCEATRDLAQTLLYFCRQRLHELRALAEAARDKPPVVIPYCPPKKPSRK